MKCHWSLSVSSNKGMSLVEITIGLGLLSLLSLVFAQMIANQTKQVQRLESKSSLLEVQNLISDTLKDQDICSKQFSDPTLGALKNVGAQTGLVDLTSAGIDIANPLKEKIQIKRVLLGATATSAVAIEVGKPLPGTISLPVSEIYISNFVKKSSANDTQYLAELVANFESTVGPIKPMKVKLAVATNTDVLSKRGIASCRTGGGTAEGGINGKTGMMVNPVFTTVVAPSITAPQGSTFVKNLGCACQVGWKRLQLSKASSNPTWSGTGTTALAAFTCIKE